MTSHPIKNLRSLAGTLASALAVCATPALQAQPAADFLTVSGNAAYLQRIAMPPEAVLTVSVEDVSRADAKATVLVGEQVLARFEAIALK